MFKKIVATLLLLCTLLTLLTPLNTNAKEKNLMYFTTKEQGEKLIYETMGIREKDYTGLCGTYVYDMLKSLKILDSSSMCYNGKDWFPGFNDDWGGNVLCKNWTYECFAGYNSLKDVLEKYNGKVYNLVLSMNSGSEYGHVMYVNAIIDDKVYFSESFYSSVFNSDQKKLIVADLQDFIDYYYNSSYFKMSKGGIIHFYEKDFYRPIIAFGGSPKVSQEKVYKFQYSKSDKTNDAMYNELKGNLVTEQFDVETTSGTTQQTSPTLVDKIKDFLSFLPFI